MTAQGGIKGATIEAAVFKAGEGKVAVHKLSAAQVHTAKRHVRVCEFTNGHGGAEFLLQYFPDVSGMMYQAEPSAFTRCGRIRQRLPPAAADRTELILVHEQG